MWPCARQDRVYVQNEAYDSATDRGKRTRRGLLRAMVWALQWSAVRYTSLAEADCRWQRSERCARGFYARILVIRRCLAVRD